MVIVHIIGVMYGYCSYYRGDVWLLFILLGYCMVTVHIIGVMYGYCSYYKGNVWLLFIL